MTEDATRAIPPADRLDMLVLDYLRACERGAAPDRAAWLAREPLLAAELRSYFADLGRFEHLVAPLRSTDAGTEAGSTTTLPLADDEDRAAGPEPIRDREFGDYELLEKVGEGGMGVVYKARQVSLNRVVALKMVLAGGHARPSDVARFRAEAEAVAALQHPNIVHIHEVGQRRGVPYLSLEFVAGGTLQQRLDGTPWPETDAARLVQVLARAMHAAHEHGIVHRDLKPGNVLLATDGTAKVTDFGLAKKLDQSDGPTVSGTILGTPSYMAPEQAAGRSREIGPACDVYALGAILYELLTGRPPFRAALPMDTILQVLQDEPAAPRLLNPKVGRDVETICLKCLRKDRAGRYASALELAEDLRRFLDREPIVARPLSPAGRLWRWCRRNPYRAVLAGVLLLVLLAGVGAGVAVNDVLRRELTQTAAAERKVRSALTRQIAERIDADLRQLAAVPQTMAATLEQRPDWTEAQLAAWMSAALASQPRLFGTAVAFEPFQFDPARQDYALYVYRDNGATRTMHLLPPAYRLYRTWDWYQDPLRLGQPVWSEPFVDEGAGNIPMITYSVPFRRRGKTAGVITADLSIRYLERLGQWLKDVELPAEDYGFVVSRRGTFLMHPNPAHRLPGKVGDAETFRADPRLADLARRLLVEDAGVAAASDPETGRPATFYFARVAATGWVVVIVDVD